MSAETPYDNLGPELILDAIEALGLVVDGRLLAMNSYENRVYQVGIDQAQPVVVKFYRPARWTDEAIGEEHSFALALAGLDIPVVPPLEFEGRTLHEHEGYRYAVFPRQGGRDPSLESQDNLSWFGRLLGRIHAVGADRPFRHRQTLMDSERVAKAIEFLFESEFVPFALKGRYKQVTDELLPRIAERFAGGGRGISIHGDCHRGNVLWTDDGPHFVDLDDCCTGPPVQDFWMLLDGERDAQEVQLAWLLEGYEQFMPFHRAQLKLVEALRGARMIEYAAWIARRWDDPAFPMHFAWFGQDRWWEDHIAGLGEQILRLDQPPMNV